MAGAQQSSPGLGSPLPHRHRDWARRCHICTGTGLTTATFAPGLGSPLPHLHRTRYPAVTTRARAEARFDGASLSPNDATIVPAMGCLVPPPMPAPFMPSMQVCPGYSEYSQGYSEYSQGTRSARMGYCFARASAALRGISRYRAGVGYRAEQESHCSQCAAGSPVPAQMWAGRDESRRRCERGEPSPGADVGGRAAVGAVARRGGVPSTTAAPELTLGSPRPTFALGLSSPRPHLRRDWAQPCHICTGIRLTPVAAVGATTA